MSVVLGSLCSSLEKRSLCYRFEVDLLVCCYLDDLQLSFNLFVRLHFGFFASIVAIGVKYVVLMAVSGLSRTGPMVSLVVAKS
ncbi:hypothetical protein L6452_20850 [Arctium lappa]|uniref:Uncharacterized protein n=1 Tax=Arctium lappa TaxID=4217 RepID=A0ACB9BC45_ARCLA|nr:hypothetical protein L6452_20850 [Arctium lappa]